MPGSIPDKMHDVELETRRMMLGALLSVVGVQRLNAVNDREPAPRFNATTLDGEKYTNESVKGKVLLLQFWTTWCPYCRADDQPLDAIAKEFEGKGLIVLAINVGESKKKVKNYLEDSPRACKVVLTDNTNLAALYAATVYPIYVLIDRDGKIADMKKGGLGEDRLRHMLQAVGLESE